MDIFTRTRIVGDFAQISALDLCSNADKRLAQSILGRSVEHLLLHLRLIRRPETLVPCDIDKAKRNLPGHEDDLVPLALIALLVLEVVDGVTALGRRQLSKEVIVVGRLVSLCDYDLRVIRRKSVDDVADLLAQLQSLELLQTVLANLHTRRLDHC